MDLIDRLVLNHIAHSPSAVALTVGALVYLDRGIMLLLKYVSAKQLDAVIDKGATLLKSEVDKDAAKGPQP